MRSLWKHVGNGISASCSGTRGGMGDERGSGELASGERAGSGFGGAPEQELIEAMMRGTSQWLGWVLGVGAAARTTSVFGESI